MPRIRPEFLAEERHCLGESWYRQEYERQKPLSHHARQLPREVTWYADPSGANEIAELRSAGFAVRKGANALRPGIGAVSARLEAGTLKVLAGRCPNLLREAGLYRYSDEAGDRRAETPVDEHNHALAALRYLVGSLDARGLGRMLHRGEHSGRRRRLGRRRPPSGSGGG